MEIVSKSKVTSPPFVSLTCSNMLDDAHRLFFNFFFFLKRLWMTMHWTLFTEPGWSILSCPTPQCTLAGGGNYIALAAPSNAEMTIIVETFQHKTSQCIRKDPKNFPEIAPTQIVTIILPEELKGTARAARKEFEVFRSCTGWRYPANDDDYMIKLSNIAASAAGNITFTATRDCYYTLTTVTGKKKPVLPSASTLTVRHYPTGIWLIRGSRWCYRGPCYGWGRGTPISVPSVR